MVFAASSGANFSFDRFSASLLFFSDFGLKNNNNDDDNHKKQQPDCDNAGNNANNDDGCKVLARIRARKDDKDND